MADNDRRKITIRIADLPAYSLMANEQEEESYRRAAKEVTNYLNQWRQRAKSLDREQQISIVALIMAQRFYESKAAYERLVDEHKQSEDAQNEKLREFESKLDEILLGMSRSDDNA